MPLYPGYGATTTHIWTTSPAPILPLTLVPVIENGQIWDWCDWAAWILYLLGDVGDVVYLLDMFDDTSSYLL